MAEDIEIEEHNLFENPKIKNLFPDISVLKQEIFDEDLSKEVNNYSNIKKKNGLIDDLNKLPNNVNIANTNKSTNHDCSFRRKIVLGSKPNNDTESQCKDLKVVLINIRPYLVKTQRFCDMCLILFRNKNSFNYHKGTTHRMSNVKCNKCMKNFSSRSNLKKHERTDIRYSNACFHCDMLFLTERDLIDHLYNVLHDKKVIPASIEHKELQNLERPISKNYETNFVPSVTGAITKIQNEGILKDIIYSCPICSYYFTYEKCCKSHVMYKHKALKTMQMIKVAFNPMCRFCNQKFVDLWSYNTHLRKNHKIEMVKQINNVNQSVNIQAETSKISTHHKYSKLAEKAKLVQNSNIKDQEQMDNVQVMALKAILYKCSECHINFLTSEAATKHFNHSTLESNWECRICHSIFKDKDASIHQKQHKCSSYFNVIEVVAEILPKTLYKCSICAVHFSQENFFNHRCVRNLKQVQSKMSSYCEVCKIYIESNIQASHENDHNVKNYTPGEFKIIDSIKPSVKIYQKTNKKRRLEDKPESGSTVHTDSSILINDDNKDEDFTTTKKQKFGIPAKKKLLCLWYCDVCKCNLSNILKTDIHLTSRCVNILKYVCKYCGLMFPNNSVTHGCLHKKYRNLKLQDFTFYNLKTNILMKPLIPEFPKCEFCEKHFISRFEVKGHLCDKTNYLICDICKTKLSSTAYKLHMPFHSYDLKNISGNSVKLTDEFESSLNDTVEHIVLPNLSSVDQVDQVILAIYTCKNCKLSVSLYDEVIEHCHLHTNLNKVEVNQIECTICHLKFESSSYMKHEELHTNFESGKFWLFSFDVLYFGYHNDNWLKHIYKTLDRKIVNKFIEQSIYRYENRIKMEVVQQGPFHLTLYKCEKCQCVIDCSSIYVHIGNCCPNSETSDCTFCGLPFACSTSRNTHEKIHSTPNITLKSYKIVMFNREQDRNINISISNIQKYYVVYECRYCHVLVEKYNYNYHICYLDKCKKCNVCGLLIYTAHVDDHVLKHKLVPSFNENKIKVVLLGKRIEDRDILETNNDLAPTFNGIVCDYTFYKCINCEVCVRDIRNSIQHSCLINAAKSQCPKCDLIFDEGKLKGHLKLHDTDPDLTNETIMVKTFSNRKSNKEAEELNKILATEPENSKKNEENITCNNKIIGHKTNASQSKTVTEMTAKLYKCTCDLHFIQKSSLLEHVKKCFGKIKTKKSIQKCSKCDLAFTSDVLFKHILEHHGDKNVVFRYDIIENSI